MLRRLALAMSCLALLWAAPARAADPDYSDIWWGPGGAESGWGVNFAQSPGFLFATFFIYGADGKPTWVTAEMFQIGSGRYSGGVYQCVGSWFGGPWVPGNAGCTLVGTAQFTAESLIRGSLVYTVNAVQVTKTIERQALTPIEVAGTYLGGVMIKGTSQCNGGSYTDLYNYQYIVKQLPQSVIRIEHVTTEAVTDCVMEGTAVQSGKVFQIPSATYVCESYGINTTANVTDLRRTSNGGLQATWTADLGSGCTETGNFAAISQQ